jgi:hypothetical protein
MPDSWGSAEEVPDLSEPETSVWGPQATPPDPGATVWDEDKPRPARQSPQGLLRRRRGNTRIEEAEGARAQASQVAAGRLMEPKSEWREDMVTGERGKAISKLTDGELTHNSGSGFGLA